MLSLANVRFVILLHVQHVGGLVAFATIPAEGADEASFRYTVLWELERAGKPVRPKDLAIPLFILPYQLSRLVDRMEAEGLVKRIQCKEDKRGHMLEPTAKGFALRKAMWAVYAPAMDDAMSRIDDKEALKLAELLNKLGGIEHADCGDKG